MATKSKSTKSTIKSIQKGIQKVQKGIDNYKNSLTTDKDKTAGQIYKTVKAPVYEDDGGIDKAIKYYGKASADFDEGDIRDRQLSLFQKEIDATNAIYADQLASAALEGQNRLGSARARSAREGTLGSDFGNTQKEGVLGLNRSIEGGIRNEQAAAVSNIMGKAREAADNEIISKRTAQKEGLDKYLEFLGTKKERQEKYKSDLAQSFLDQGVAPEEIDPKELSKIAKSYGLKTDDVLATYSKTKKAADAAKAEADAKARKEMSFSLSEGQARYEYDPITGEYTQVASRAKTYAPTDGGGGNSSGKYVPGADPTVDAWANGIKAGTRKITDIPAKNGALRNAVQVALDAMGESDSKRMELDTNLTLLDDLIKNPKLKKLSGGVDQFAGGYFGKAALAKNKYNQIKGILALDNRQKLKGSGAISDFEFQVLTQAASALGRNLSDEDFVAEIKKVRDVFQAARDRADLIESQQNGGVSEAPVDAAPARSNTLQDADGNSFDASSLTEEEYQQALDEGYVAI